MNIFQIQLILINILKTWNIVFIIIKDREPKMKRNFHDSVCISFGGLI